MKTRYKSLFFDLDDTLWDTTCNNKECLEEIFADYAFDRHYDSFDSFYQVYMPHNVMLWKKYRNHEIDRQTLILERFLYVLRPMGIEDHAYVLNLNHDFLQRTASKTKLVPGAIDLLDYLQPFYRLFILSNGFREIQVLKLQNSHLASFFEKVILSEDANIQKPHKEIFDFALQNTNSRRNESLMIGDCLEADIEGAFHAKIDQLWYNPENKPFKRIVPTYQVRTLSEIEKIL
jgi:putative hydrolase of the HAD superfamily